MTQVDSIEDTDSEDRFSVRSGVGQQLLKVHSGIDSFGALVTSLFYLLLQRPDLWMRTLVGQDGSTAS